MKKGHVLIAWVLMVAAGGEGPFAVIFGPTPVAVFASAQECDRARGRKIQGYRENLLPPIRSGYDYIEGGTLSGTRDAPTTSKQLYILTCETTKGR